MAWICPRCHRRNSGAPRRCSCGATVRVTNSNPRPIRDDDDDCDTLIDVMIIGSMTGAFDSSSSSSSSSYERSTSSYDSSSSSDSGSSSSDSGGSCD